MARAHPFATAGGGTLFEYKVACLFGCDLLCARYTALGGSVTSVATQTGPAVFDDLQITLELPDGTDATVHTQCRHRQKLTGSDAKFKELFANALTAVAADPEAFASRKHRLLLVVDETSPGHASMTQLCRLARGSATTVAFEGAVAAQAGRVSQRLTHCRTASGLNMADLHLVLSAMDVLPLALDEPEARDSVELINRLSGLWSPADPAAALDLGHALFTHLCQVGPRAGVFDLRSLQDELRAWLPKTIGASSRRARLGRLKAAGEARVTRSLELLGLDEASAAQIAASALGEPPMAVTEDLAVVVGSMGIGKTTELERQHRRAIDAALADTNSPIPVFVHARDFATSSVKTVITAATEGLGDPSRVGVHLIIDGLDEAGVTVDDILQRTAPVSAIWPNSKVILATRPEAPTPRVLATPIEPLSAERAETLIEAIHDRSTSWLPSRGELTDLLRRPLYAILYALARREGNLLATHPANLVASVSQRAVADLDLKDSEGFQLLTRLACEIMDSPGDSVELSALGLNPLQIARLSRSRILEVGDGRGRFQLAALAEWFAASEILSTSGRLDASLATPLAAHRWRYALTQAILQGSDEDADRIMTAMLRTRPGVAAWVFAEAQAPSGVRRDAPLPATATEAGVRIRHAARHWLDPWPTLQASYTFDGEMPVLGIAVDNHPGGSTLTTAWRTQRADGDLVVPLPDGIDPFGEPDPAWTGEKFGSPSHGRLWPWDWTRDRYQRHIDNRLENRQLLAGISVCWSELAWDYAYRMLGRSPEVRSAPVPIEGLEAAIARVIEVEPAAREVFIGSGRYGWRLSEGKAFVDDLRRLGIDQVESPWPAADTRADWTDHCWTTNQLLARLHLTTKAALDAYAELVDQITPAMAPELPTFQLLPARVVGELTPGNASLGMEGSPRFRSYLEPLPTGSDNEAVWTVIEPQGQVDEPWDQMADEWWEQMAASIRQQRGEFAILNNLVIHYGNTQVFSSTPAGSLALAFFAADLAALKWTTQSGRVDSNAGSVRPTGR